MRAAISVMQSTSMRSRTRLERVAEVCVPALPHEPTSSCSSLIKSDQHGCTTPQRTETRSQKKKEKKKKKKIFCCMNPDWMNIRPLASKYSASTVSPYCLFLHFNPNIYTFCIFLGQLASFLGVPFNRCKSALVVREYPCGDWWLVDYLRMQCDGKSLAWRQGVVLFFTLVPYVWNPFWMWVSWIFLVLLKKPYLGCHWTCLYLHVIPYRVMCIIKQTMLIISSMKRDGLTTWYIGKCV